MIDHSGLQCEIRANWTPLRCNLFFLYLTAPVLDYYHYFAFIDILLSARMLLLWGVLQATLFLWPKGKVLTPSQPIFIQSCTSKFSLRQLWKANGMHRKKGVNKNKWYDLISSVFFLGLTAIQSSDRKCLDQVCGAIRLEDSLTAKESFVVKYQACKRQ